VDNNRHHQWGEDPLEAGGGVWCNAEQGSVVTREGCKSTVGWWEQLEQLVIYHHKCWMCAFLAGSSSWLVDYWH